MNAVIRGPCPSVLKASALYFIVYRGGPYDISFDNEIWEQLKESLIVWNI